MEQDLSVLREFASLCEGNVLLASDMDFMVDIALSRMTAQERNQLSELLRKLGKDPDTNFYRLWNQVSPGIRFKKMPNNGRDFLDQISKRLDSYKLKSNP